MAYSKFKAENGILVTGDDSFFEKQLTTAANLNVQGSTMFIGQDLIVAGNLIYSNTSVMGDLTPNIPGSPLGNTTNRFSAWFTTISASGNVIPTANGINLGNTTNRWNVYATNGNFSGITVLSGNVTIGSSNTLFVDTINKTITVNASSNTTGNVNIVGNIAVGGYSNVAGNATIGGDLTVNGSANISGNVSLGGITVGPSALIANSVTFNSGSSTVIDSFPYGTSNFYKHFVAVEGTNVYHSIELSSIYDGTNVFVTKYGENFTGNCGTFDIDKNGANIEVKFIPAFSNNFTVNTIRFMV